MFITFEGVEGAGKTTQIVRLGERLREQSGASVLITREPGAGPLGAELRRLILEPPLDMEIDPRAELLLLMADRAQHVSQIIRPHLKSGGVVLCDRFTDSSIAYQGYGRSISLTTVANMNVFATGALIPDLTLLLDLDPEIGLLRQKERTRIENETIAFHRRVRAGYRTLATHEPKRVHVLDASQSPETVAEAVWGHVCHLLSGLPAQRSG